jgi:very-short-patch-repair endonuclease
MVTHWEKLLVRQQGLITRAQAEAFGITPATLHRRTTGPRPAWQRVHRRVYATFVHPVTDQQKTIAAWLYAGPGAVVTGAAALHWRGMTHLPSDVLPTPVDVLLPVTRGCQTTDLVRVQRTLRPARTSTFNHVVCANVARATADCARHLTCEETVLSVVASVLNSKKTTLAQLATELTEGPTRGSSLLRRVLLTDATKVRSVPEAALLQLIATTGLPTPLVNEPIVVGGKTLLPDIRWGRLIVEVDSKEWHLLNPGSWEATQKRRLALQAAGYFVIPITPDQIRNEPGQVVAAILAAYRQHVAA